MPRTDFLVLFMKLYGRRREASVRAGDLLGHGAAGSATFHFPGFRIFRRDSGSDSGSQADDSGSRFAFVLVLFAVGALTLAPVQAQEPEARPADPLEILAERLDRLEAENRDLRKELEALRAEQPRHAVEPEFESPATGFVHVDALLGHEVLDPSTNINRRQRTLLDRRQNGILAPDRLYLHGAITAITSYQSSNRDSKFGYLMRHPTTRNQVGHTVSEAGIHSVQLGVTGTLGDWMTGHAEILFDPQQSFGTGTNTDLNRNQLQVRRAYALLGDLDRSPIHASLGKMSVPFGLMESVNPFSASSTQHAFSGLANGATVGYAGEKLNLTLMGIQGGAQFRAVNTPVKGTATPSRLNNFALDANTEFDLASGYTLLLGGSYLHGSAYCQDFPVAHFARCRDNNPAFDVYGRLAVGNLTLRAEMARTMDVWPGTFNPALPGFPASKVTSLDIGAKYRHDAHGTPVDLSAEFSRFIAGPPGAPWEHQDQTGPGRCVVSPTECEVLRGVHPRQRIRSAKLHQRRQHRGRGRRTDPRRHPQRSLRPHGCLAGRTEPGLLTLQGCRAHSGPPAAIARITTSLVSGNSEPEHPEQSGSVAARESLFLLDLVGAPMCPVRSHLKSTPLRRATSVPGLP